MDEYNNNFKKFKISFFIYFYSSESKLAFSNIIICGNEYDGKGWKKGKQKKEKKQEGGNR